MIRCVNNLNILKRFYDSTNTTTVNQDFLACADFPNVTEQTLIAYAETQTKDDQPVDDYQLTFFNRK